MTNEELIAKIKAEIDKLYGEYKDKFHQSRDQYHLGLIDGLDMAERVLDTLESEKPMQEGLEEETVNYCFDNGLNLSPRVATDFARHFAEWGYLRAAEKYNEVEYNRQRAEENEKPSVKDAMKELNEKIALVKERGTWDGVDVDKYMDEVRGREPEKPMGQEKEVKPCHRTREKLAEWSKTQEGRESYEKVAEEMRKQIVPNDLEKAARKSAIAPFNLDVDEEHLYEYPYLPIAEQKFIEGAKWQAEQKPKDEQFPPLEGLDAIKAKYYDDGFKNGFDEGVEEGRRLAEEEQADLFTIVALDAAQRAKEQMMENYPKWRRIKAGERLPCPAYVWTIAYDNYPDCFEGRLMPNIQGVKVGRDTWYLPVDVIHNLPKED